MTALRVAVVGFGKIARDQHIPAIAATESVMVAAIASRHASLPDLPHFGALGVMLESYRVRASEAEYRGLYRRFVEMTMTGAIDVDLTPLRLVADALMLGRRRIVEPFEE